MEYIFVYGTLQNPVILENITGRTAKTLKGLLKGYKKGTIVQDGIEYPIIKTSNNPDDFISGLYFKVSEDELNKLDEYEGEGYIRKKVKLVNGIMAWVYCE